jgi:hypothetical protein
MSNMTGYTFERGQLENIAMNRGVSNVKSFSDLTVRDRNLLLADMLFVIITSPSSTASVSKQHGDYSTTVGSVRIENQDALRKLMTALYSNPDKELNDILTSYQGGVFWVHEID